MSKAELFQQLETLSPDELDQGAERLDELRGIKPDDEIPAEHRAILEERMADYQRTPEEGEGAHAVVARILKDLKK